MKKNLEKIVEIPGTCYRPCQRFTCDEIKEIFAGLGPLHDDDEGIVPLKIIEKAHYARLPQQLVH